MAGDEVHEIKSRLDIVELVGDYVALKKNGRTWWGRCPFHTEKTPSFSVSQERQTFHCFGCGKGGDIFSFVMEMEHLEFREALERLAEKAGVRLEPRSGRRPEQSAAQRNINGCALDFFKNALNDRSGEAARAYLARRTITREAADRFELGWAPSSWNLLTRHLSASGFSAAQIEESGLVSKGDKGLYDRFRGRVMFPIYSITDRLIGFGGRILDGDGAKYLNSPESPVFNKRNNLYLLNKAKNSIREKNCVILTEGYMDAIRCHLCGYTNTVASLGTSLTEAQAALIKRMTGLCYICYDSDAAGQEAALRGMYVLQRQGVAVRVVRLRGGKDPDEILLKQDGKELFEHALKDALPLPVYHAMLRGADMNEPEKALAARNDLLDGLSSLSTFDVLPYMDKIGAILGIFPHELKKELDNRQDKVRGGETHAMPEDDFAGYDEPQEDEEPADDLECVFCSLLWNDAELRASMIQEPVVSYIENAVIQSTISALVSGESPESLETRWRQMGDMAGLNLLARGNGIAEREGYRSESAGKVLDKLRKRCVEKRMKVLLARMTRGTASDDEQKEYQRLNKVLKGGRFGL